MSTTARLSYDGSTISDEDLLSFFSDDKPRIVHRVNGEAFDRAVRTGTPYTAICGRTWVPRRPSYHGREVATRRAVPCDACEVIHNQQPSA